MVLTQEEIACDLKIMLKLIGLGRYMLTIMVIDALKNFQSTILSWQSKRASLISLFIVLHSFLHLIETKTLPWNNILNYCSIIYLLKKNFFWEIIPNMYLFSISIISIVIVQSISSINSYWYVSLPPSNNPINTIR